MKRLLQSAALLCLATGLLFCAALAGCSPSRHSNFANMSKEEQLRAWRNLPPEEVAINRKMWLSLQEQSKAARQGRPRWFPPRSGDPSPPGPPPVARPCYGDGGCHRRHGGLDGSVARRARPRHGLPLGVGGRGAAFPNNPRPLYHLGLRWLQLGQPEPAEQALRRAASLDGDDEKSWLGAAVAAAACGDSSGRTGHRHHLFSRHHPNSAAGHLTIAQLCRQQGSMRHAYEEAMTAARLAPHGADAWRLAGEAAMPLGDLPAAEQALRQAVAQDSRDWRSRVALGGLLTRCGPVRGRRSLFRDRCAPRSVGGAALSPAGPAAPQPGCRAGSGRDRAPVSTSTAWRRPTRPSRTIAGRLDHGCSRDTEDFPRARDGRARPSS